MAPRLANASQSWGTLYDGPEASASSESRTWRKVSVIAAVQDGRGMFAGNTFETSVAGKKHQGAHSREQPPPQRRASSHKAPHALWERA